MAPAPLRPGRKLSLRSRFHLDDPMARPIRLAVAGALAGAFTFFSLGLFSPVVTAVPLFARKTGLACSSCHEVWPRLNSFGQNFRDRGYRIKRDRDLPVEQEPAYFPLSFRTTAGYQWLRQTLVATDTGPVTTQTGTFGFTGLDVWAAGTLGDRLSFAITYTPGLGGTGFQLAGNPTGSDLESAWIGFNDVGLENWVNFRVGKHALDLPIDEHRQITLTSGYNVYHFHPQGSQPAASNNVTFEPGNNQAGVELYGHSELSRVRYSISLVNERDSAIFSNNVISNPILWGHLTAEQYLDNPVLASVKAGLFGAVGRHPSATSTLTPPGAGAAPGPLQGTGFGKKTHSTYGAELHLQFLSVVNPFTLTTVLWGNTQDQALLTGATQDASWRGLFVEGVYTWSPRLSLIGRYERIRTTRQGDPTQFLPSGDLTSLTGAIRHTFELTSRTEAALQLELTRKRTTAGDGTLPDLFTGLVAFDFTM